MKRTIHALILIFLLLMLDGSVVPLLAGQVTLEVSTTTGLEQGEVFADFRVVNRGNDNALETRIIGNFQGKQQSVFLTDRLKPGQTADASISFKAPDKIKGAYPLYITVYYLHADGTSASTASLAIVNIGGQRDEILKLKPSRGTGTEKNVIRVDLETEDPAQQHIRVTAHGPDDLVIEPAVQDVNLQEGRGTAQFRVAISNGNQGSVYGIFFGAEFEKSGLHHLATADIALPVADILHAQSFRGKPWNVIFMTIFFSVAALLLGAVLINKKFRQRLFRTESISPLLDVMILLAVEVFIFSQFDLPSLFTTTITTGGDTASHYYTLEYLRHFLLPAGKISGWTMGNYAGFPILQFYFPLPFLIMCFLNLVIPLQIAFKLVTLLGTALLPLSAYVMLRQMRCPFPGPGLASVFMLPFLFNGVNTMWGGNILSTLAGEFSYSLSMSLSLILIGSLYQGAKEDKWIIRNGVLVFLVGFSHGYTLLFAEAISLFLLITLSGFSRRVFYLFRVYALGFCLLAFWLLPLLAFTKYTTSYHLVWTIYSIKEIVPEILLPIVLAGIGGSIILLFWGLLHYNGRGSAILVQLAYLWFGLAAAVVFYVAAPRLGIVDIRYIPYGQLMLCLAAALFLGWTAEYLRYRWHLDRVLLIGVAALVMVWTGGRTGSVNGWSKWNYEGFEAKKAWPVFARINKELAGTFQDPRVVFEHSQDHNIFGSTRAFESLPLFAGRATLEGLYMQASLSAPFVFYIQSMISLESSQPFPQYSYTKMDFARARDYLKLFNVRELILKSSAAKEAIRRTPDYSLLKTIGQYEIWELNEKSYNYVVPLQYEPIAYVGTAPWKEAAHQWFSREKLDGIHLVFNAANDTQKSPLRLRSGSPDTLSGRRIDTAGCTVNENIANESIEFETTCPGKPHLIKVSYHPNWQVEGAGKIYLVSPSFMLVYPEDTKVTLTYIQGSWDRLGQIITAFGVLVLLLHVPLPGPGRRTTWTVIAKRLAPRVMPFSNLLPDPSHRARKIILLVVLVTAGGLIALGSYRTYVNEPYRTYNRSIHYKDAGQYALARAGFRKFVRVYPLANLARESSYYIGITYYLEKKDEKATAAFEDYIEHYPHGSRLAEVYYHIGLLQLRSGLTDKGIQTMRLVTDKFSGTPWAGYAGERLQENGAATADVQLNINRDNLQEYMGRAITLFNQDRLDEAKPIFLQISDRFPDFTGAPQALAALALCYYKEGDCANTIRYYSRLVGRYPHDRLAAEAYFHLGLCFDRQGDTKQAEDAYKRVLALDKNGVYGKQAGEKLSHDPGPKD